MGFEIAPRNSFKFVLSRLLVYFTPFKLVLLKKCSARIKTVKLYFSI